MERKKGKLKWTVNKKGAQVMKMTVDAKDMPIENLDTKYFNKSWDGRECEVEYDKDKIVSVFVGKERIGGIKQKAPDPKPIAAPAKQQHQHGGFHAQPQPPRPAGGFGHPMAAPTARKTVDAAHARLPQATKDLLPQISDVSHFGLKHGKFVWYEPDDGKACVFVKDKYSLDSFRFDDKMIAALAQRQKAAAQALCPATAFVELASSWRVVTGLGIESAYEVGLCLHHTYGFPYLPGQTIKGVVRGHVIAEHFGKNEKAAAKDPGFVAVFGCDDEGAGGEFRRGGVAFFDGLPKAPPKIAADIMNPHFGEYYKDGLPPGEYYNPVPVYFLAVENLRVEFVIGLLPRAKPVVSGGKFDGQRCLDLAGQWLREALSGRGIGAKTAVGYGRMG